ncbi:MAG: tetratricopeptide repeat protein [Bryobacteraceae bacterium]
MRGWIASLLLCASAFAAAPASDLDRANQLYERTHYQESLKVLLPLTPSGPVLEGIGKNYFMMGEFKKAQEYFEKAIASDPSNSVYHHWLGKTYGRRAETSAFITAPGYASKARQSFEKAVALDPRNKDAINDLFEYYVEAPGFLGGGLDKADALTQTIGSLDPAEYQFALAVLAEHRKEFGSAEQHLRRALDLAPRQVGRVIDLAKFLAKQGKTQESDAVFEQAEKISPNDPKVMFAKADAYIHSKRNMEAAKALLERYLKAPLTPDDPSRAEAQKLLKMASGV